MFLTDRWNCHIRLFDFIQMPQSCQCSAAITVFCSILPFSVGVSSARRMSDDGDSAVPQLSPPNSVKNVWICKTTNGKMVVTIKLQFDSAIFIEQEHRNLLCYLATCSNHHTSIMKLAICCVQAQVAFHHSERPKPKYLTSPLMDPDICVDWELHCYISLCYVLWCGTDSFVKALLCLSEKDSMNV